ncbi:DUF3187 family protein [Geomonas sp. RF6]|uniref:DUF3187 family protein n=1 Tax=Geomonas sp. RF6 TaxID=2897342 RepID=UPI001E5AE11C|nr:DUF3187 family protein [Geomonas sp. RF6]UFS71976.1 DUF3187 family protein [Geomonas sp. RF6]
MKRNFRLFRLLLLVPSLLLAGTTAGAAELGPFNTQDQSPLVQIYGLPAQESATVLGKGRYLARVALDVANNNAIENTPRESITLDGESWRTTLTLRRGFEGGLEGGIEIPFVYQGGGVFDDFIENWHDFFGLPQGGRKEEPQDRLSYVYTKDSRERLRMDRSRGGIGDVRLTGGYQLYQDLQNGRAVAVRAALKLPTGESSRLHGSGSTDLSLWLSAQQDLPLERLGAVAFFGSLGGLAKTRGDVIPDQERYLVGFGSLGAGWTPWRPVAFKVQLSGHSPFYHGSSLDELDAFSLLLLTGGTISFSESTSLDIGVSEDIIVNASPDVAFHLSLSTKF